MSAVIERDKLGRFPKGVSGNPAGKIPGTRTAFSAAFIRDFLNDWYENGAEVIVKVRETNPSLYFATGSRLCPQDVSIQIEARSASDYRGSSMSELLSEVNGHESQVARRPGNKEVRVAGQSRALEGEAIEVPDSAPTPQAKKPRKKGSQ